MRVRTGLTSQFPRSETLVRATRESDRGRLGVDALETAYRTAENEVVALERNLGFDGVTAGLMRWADLLRPFAESWEGFSVGPLTRWMQTNTFYRQPVLLGPPLRTPGAIAARLPPTVVQNPEEGQVLLPGPFTFAELTENRSGEPDQALVHRLGRLLAEEVVELKTRGFSRFVFVEPVLVAQPPEGPAAEAVVAAYRSIHAAADGARTIVWTYGADAIPALSVLDRLPVSVLGIDLTETEAERLPTSPGHTEIGLGVVDPSTTLLEEPTEIVRVVRMAAQRRGISEVYLAPGAPLDLLPADVAHRKLGGLPEVARALKGDGR